MNLIIDIGNSFTKLAVYSGNSQVWHNRYSVVEEDDIKDTRKRFPFRKVIISSVRRESPGYIDLLKQDADVLFFDHQTPTPLNLLYETPETLGLDRLAGVVGAFNSFPDENILVIDAGTCVTFDYVDSAGNYQGGNISPGIELRLRAMHEFTAALPLVKRSFHPDMLGKSTEMAIQNGAIRGLIFEIEAFIRKLTQEKGDLKVILTGGDAIFLGEKIESKIFVNPHIVLKGLNDILKYNNE